MRITGTIISFLKRWPLHLLLLGLFFIASIYVQLAGLLSFSEFVWAFLKIMLWLLIFFMIFYFVYKKDKAKAGLVVTVCATIFLFFGSIKDMLASLPVLRYISSYTVLLPFLFILAIFFFFKMRKKRSLANATLFLNLLFIIYVGIAIWDITRLLNGVRLINQHNISLTPPQASSALPDIYYIIMDGYPSSRYQQEKLGVAYNSLDSALSAKGFYILNNPVSNYNYTAFSMASVFQLQYIDWLHGVIIAEPYHFSNGALEVSRSIVPAWLKGNGYRFYNLSIFDWPGLPSPGSKRFFYIIPPSFIFRHTLWTRLKWEVIPTLFPSYKKTLTTVQLKENKKTWASYGVYNNHMLDSLRHLPSRQKQTPKFVYTHFEMPHNPFFYDSTGRSYPDDELFSLSTAKNKEKFSHYIAYVNKQMAMLIDSIQHAGNSNSIIILQSDHGSRDVYQGDKPADINDVFKNYSAFYFPDRDYRLLYDSMSNVNTFRVIFNKYFGQQLPLLKDSSIYIKY